MTCPFDCPADVAEDLSHNQLLRPMIPPIAENISLNTTEPENKLALARRQILTMIPPLAAKQAPTLTRPTPAP